jgi:hypothetical protein
MVALVQSNLGAFIRALSVVKTLRSIFWLTYLDF